MADKRKCTFGERVARRILPAPNTRLGGFKPFNWNFPFSLDKDYFGIYEHTSRFLHIIAIYTC